MILWTSGGICLLDTTGRHNGSGKMLRQGYPLYCCCCREYPDVLSGMFCFLETYHSHTPSDLVYCVYTTVKLMPAIAPCIYHPQDVTEVWYHVYTTPGTSRRCGTMYIPPPARHGSVVPCIYHPQHTTEVWYHVYTTPAHHGGVVPCIYHPYHVILLHS